MDESELIESLSFLPSSSLLFCDREGFGGRLGTPDSPTALGRLSFQCWLKWFSQVLTCYHLAGRGGRPELSGVMPEDSLLESFEVLKFLHHSRWPQSRNGQLPDMERGRRRGGFLCGSAAPTGQTGFLSLHNCFILASSAEQENNKDSNIYLPSSPASASPPNWLLTAQIDS